MGRWVALLLLALLAGCASVQRAPPPGADIFRDELFGSAPPPPDLGELFAITPAMQRYLDERIRPQVRRKGPQMALLDALYTQGELRLDYDATHTRGAGEAFAAGRGNCLSLVIMTAAFANELGLQVRYQEVLATPAVEHDGDLTFLVGHVNLALGSDAETLRSVDNGRQWVVVDFLPGQDLQRQRTQLLDDRRVRAMFMNNRAAEAMARGRIHDAYWWLRAAYAQDPTLANLYNTLGVVYRRQGALAEAERALRIAQAMDPDNDHVASNLAGTLRAAGRATDAERVARTPLPAPSRFGPARKALAAGQPQQALQMLLGELGLTPRNAELHHWLAMSYAQAGDLDAARRHLALAAEFSGAADQRQRYAGKLERLKALGAGSAPVHQ